MDNCLATIHQPFWRRGDQPQPEDNQYLAIANALRIVQAVNLHEELIEALCVWERAFRVEKELQAMRGEPVAAELLSAFGAGQRALAKALGKELQ